MIDIITPTIFPNDIISGVATGCVLDSEKMSYFETPYYSSESIINSRNTLESLNINVISRFYYQKQIHSDIILIDKTSKSTDIIESDAVISNHTGILYNVSIADCQAILAYDPVNKAVAAIHSGWKGTSLDIVGKTLIKMTDTYGTEPSDLLVYLAPSACVDNYEVGPEFNDIFPKATIRLEGKYYFDNRKEILNQLLVTGVQKKNIESNNDCTITNNRYHSYRRDKGDSGRMSAFIGIRSK